METESSSSTAVADINLEAVAEAVAEAVTAPPRPLPQGWILKESRTQPGYYYYYDMETGVCSWDPPFLEQSVVAATNGIQMATGNSSSLLPANDPVTTTSTSTEITDNNKRPAETEEEAEASSNKRPKLDSSESSSPSADTSPKEVHVLHILKKHKGSRRPSSWRMPKITQTLDEAKEELNGLLEILLEEEGNPKELQATFEELARTESDCSSAKRGGDLGYFGRNKMQPAFEEASFGLKVGEMTKELVETSSGVHILLRIG
jgi:peptidyl-prolyl cis-trans isomerase NIMA-interacting 1